MSDCSRLFVLVIEIVIFACVSPILANKQGVFLHDHIIYVMSLFLSPYFLIL